MQRTSIRRNSGWKGSFERGAALCEMAVLMPLYTAFILGVFHLWKVGNLEQAVTLLARYGAWSKSSGDAQVRFPAERFLGASKSAGASLDGPDALLLQHLLDGPDGKGGFSLESKVSSTLEEDGILKRVRRSTAHQTNLPGPLLRNGRGRAGRRQGLEDPAIRMKVHFDEAERLILKTDPGKPTSDFLIRHPAWSPWYKPDRGKIPRPY